MEGDLEKLAKAFQQSKDQLEAIYQKTWIAVGVRDAEIIQAHQMILEDATFYDEIKDSVGNELLNA